METRIARCDKCKLAFRWPSWSRGFPGSLYGRGGVPCPYCGKLLRRTTYKSPYRWLVFTEQDSWPIGPSAHEGERWSA
jgi:hypothetical protein